MKRILFKSDGYTGWINRNNLEDALDVKRFPPMKFKELRELMTVDGKGPRRDAKRKALEILSEFFAEVGDEMVELRSVFVFPRRNFGFMGIRNVGNDPDSAGYNGEIVNDFIVPGGRITLDSLVKRVNGNKEYRFKMTRRRRRKVKELQKTGTRYVE